MSAKGWLLFHIYLITDMVIAYILGSLALNYFYRWLYQG